VRYEVVPPLLKGGGLDRAQSLIEMFPEGGRYAFEIAYSNHIFGFRIYMDRGSPDILKGVYPGMVFRELGDPDLPDEVLLLGVGTGRLPLREPSSDPLEVMMNSLAQAEGDMLYQLFFTGPVPGPESYPKELREAARRHAHLKHFYFEIRILASGPDARTMTETAISALNSTSWRWNSLRWTSFRRSRLDRVLDPRPLRGPLGRRLRPSIASSLSLALLAHIPDVLGTGIAKATVGGLWRPSEGVVVGLDLRGSEVRIPVHVGHTVVLGKTGMGKSTLLLNMALQLAERGVVVLVDPHGGLARGFATALPEEHLGRLLYFAPHRVVMGFNALHVEDRGDEFAKEKVVSDIKTVMRRVDRLYSRGGWGARLDYILSNLLRALMEIEGANLLDARMVLVDDWYRKMLSRRVKDPVLRMFLLQELPKMHFEERRSALSKLSALTTNKLIRASLCHRGRTFSVSEALKGGILVAELPKGLLGMDVSSVIGTVFLTSVWLSLLKSPGREVYLILDEFHNFASPSLVEMLSEGRKFGLRLVMATQYVGQVPEYLWDSVEGNALNFVSFAVGKDTAEALSRATGMDPGVLMNLERHEFIAFSHGFAVHGRSLPPPPPRRDLGEVIALMEKYAIKEDNSVEPLLAVGRAG